MSSKDIANTLFEKYNIWTVARNRPGVHGCRITPNIFTSTKELDLFVDDLEEIAI